MGTPRVGRVLAPRATIVRLKNAPKKYVGHKRLTDDVDVRMADMASGVGKVNHSRYWAPRFCEEKDRFSSVRVYDAEGNLTRTIARETLNRPFPQKAGIGWNSHLFL